MLSSATLTIVGCLLQTALKLARDVDDRMNYVEPPRLYQPTRQCLGALLLHMGRPGEAQQAFEEDLAQHPHNVWSLTGLSQAAAAQGHALADDIKDEVVKARLQADIPVTSSCITFAHV